VEGYAANLLNCNIKDLLDVNLVVRFKANIYRSRALMKLLTILPCISSDGQTALQKTASGGYWHVASIF